MKIAIIGAGAMGGSFADGLLKGTLFRPEDITVANPHEEKLLRFKKAGAHITTDNCKAIAGADYVAIVVKPWLVEQVLQVLKPAFNPAQQTLINMAAAISSANLLQWIEKDGQTPTLFQAIPNIAIAIRQSMTFLASPNATAEEVATMCRLFNDLGKALFVEERLLGMGTAMAGCGIAYAMRYVRAAMEGGVELGFKADLSRDIVLQTVKGAVALLEATGHHPEAEIDKVTTPGGLTIKGLNEMEHAGFTSAVVRGLKACCK